MKTAKLKNGLICISVPNKWERFYIDTVKSIGYFENNILVFFDPNILMLPHIQILGTITANECSFDCSEYVKKDKGSVYYLDYKLDCYNSSPIDSFKSMIENETEFLFENPKPNINNFDFRDKIHNDKILKEWNQAQSRVIEKLLILKTI
jgi:hypothetical protein